jgi:hypothetical protein
MKWVKYGICVSAALVAALWAQTRIGEMQMPSSAGTGIRAIVAGVSRLLPLDPSLEIVAIGGNPPVLRVTPAPATALRTKTVALPYTGIPVILPDTPAGAVLVFCGGLAQTLGTDYTLSGTILSPTTAAQPAWQAQGSVLVFYVF